MAKKSRSKTDKNSKSSVADEKPSKKKPSDKSEHSNGQGTKKKQKQRKGSKEKRKLLAKAKKPKKAKKAKKAKASKVKKEKVKKKAKVRKIEKLEKDNPVPSKKAKKKRKLSKLKSPKKKKKKTILNNKEKRRSGKKKEKKEKNCTIEEDIGLPIKSKHKIKKSSKKRKMYQEPKAETQRSTKLLKRQKLSENPAEFVTDSDLEDSRSCTDAISSNRTDTTNEEVKSDSSSSDFSVSAVRASMGLPSPNNAKKHNNEISRKTKPTREMVKTSCDDDSESDNSNDDDIMSFSINELKRGMGLYKESEEKPSAAEILSEDDERDSENRLMNINCDESAGQALQKELTCTMCLSILYKPVAVSCGHSFCRVCLCTALQKLMRQNNRFRCPVCRKILCQKCLNRFSVNATLWNVIQRAFPNECKERDSKAERNDFEKCLIGLRGEDFIPEIHATKSENALAGRLRDETTLLSQDVRFYRTVVRNPNDYVMHLALGIERNPDPLPLFARKVGGGQWKIGVSVLELEEDEDADSGFPAFITTSSDDREMIKTSFDGELRMEVKRLSGVSSLSEGSKYGALSPSESEPFEIISSKTVSCAGGSVFFTLNLDKKVQPGIFRFCFSIVGIEICSMYFESRINAFDSATDKKSELKVEQRTSKYFSQASHPIPHAKQTKQSISLDKHMFDDEDMSEEEDEDDSLDGFVVDDDAPIEMESGEEESDGMEEVVIVRRKKKPKARKTRARKVSISSEASIGSTNSFPENENSDTESKAGIKSKGRAIIESDSD